MKTFLLSCCASLLMLGFTVITAAQGDVRSATGLPIPIGQPVIWGQVELRGLRPDEPRPVVTVLFLFNGAQIAQYQANDKGYYYFLERARDGAELLVRVGGMDAGRVVINSTSGDRHDMSVNWDSGQGLRGKPGVVSIRDAYSGRSSTNSRLFDSATAAAKQKKTEEAIKLFSDITRIDSKDFVAWTELGSLYFGHAKHSEAVQSYSKALELKPDFMPALMNLGKLHMAEKKFVDAIAVLEKAAIADPSSADAFHYLGESYLQNKQGSKAVTVLNEAIRLAPVEKAEIHLRLATLYNAAGLKDRAVNEYKLFLQKLPNHPEKAKLEKYIKDNS